MKFSAIVFLGLIASSDAHKLVQKSSTKDMNMEDLLEGADESEAVQTETTEQTTEEATVDTAATEEATAEATAEATTEATTETTADASSQGAGTADLQSNVQAFADKLGIPLDDSIL